MDKFKYEAMPEFKIETIKTPEGNEISFCPERGGIITSIKFKGIEVFYLDESTFKDTGKNVRGGAPNLFPHNGPVKSAKYPNLNKQHGFARDEKWESTSTPDGFIETLKSNISTKNKFPFDFNLKIRGSFEKDGSFNIIQSVKNLEKNKEMPVSYGLHPYFKVSSEEKKNIKFNFKEGEMIENQVDVWSNDGTVSINNPGIPMRIEIPGLGVLVLTASKEYKKILIWSQPGKDFICIEPVMRDEGGFIDDPENVKPGDIYSASFNIKLEQ